MTTIDHQAWLNTFRDLLHFYLPPFENTAAVNTGGLVAMLVGLFLVFRSARFERGVVCAFAMVVGAVIGLRVAPLINAQAGPLSAAVGAIVLTAIAYRTYRLWLGAGSVIVLFCIAMMFQVGKDLPQWKLPSMDEATAKIKAVELPSAAQQQHNLYPVGAEQWAKVQEQLVAQLKNLGASGWLIPVGAAIVGGLFAYWALRGFVVVWLGFLGAAAAVLGAITLICTHRPELRNTLIDQPQIAAGSILGLWLLGLMLQAKEARFPKKKPAEGGGKEPVKAMA